MQSIWMSELLTLSLLPKNITHVIHRHLSGKNYKREIKLEITEASVYGCSLLRIHMCELETLLKESKVYWAHIIILTATTNEEIKMTAKAFWLLKTLLYTLILCYYFLTISKFDCKLISKSIDDHVLQGSLYTCVYMLCVCLSFFG